MKNFTIEKGFDSVSVSGEFPGEVRLVAPGLDLFLYSHEVDQLIGGLDRLNGDLHDSSLLDLIEELVKICLRDCENTKDLRRVYHAWSVADRFRARSANWTEEEPF